MHKTLHKKILCSMSTFYTKTSIRTDLVIFGKQTMNIRVPKKDI